MSQAFVIMQIGNKDLDNFFDTAIAPAVENCGLDIKRVDKHNEGGLLKSEIISFIENSEIIIADLTNERPNCYLEIGYAMGIDKFKNLILTVREDHFPESKNFQQGGPKIHFDLAGYDILSWDSANLSAFSASLENRIKRRLMLIAPQPGKTEIESTWDYEWLESHRTKANDGLSKQKLSGAMELCFALTQPKIHKTQTVLNEVAETAQIKTSGWPIGVYIHRDPYRPQPKVDGIEAEIITESYDYWALRKNGDFYSLISLFEDKRGKVNNIFFDTRIVRVTESIMYCARLYTHLDVDKDQIIKLSICHSGLQDREIVAASSSRFLHDYPKSTENEVQTEIYFTINEVESDLTQLVKQIVQPLFVLFGFCEVSDKIIEEIVDKFISGEI